MKTQHMIPDKGEPAYNCPVCHAYAQQNHTDMFIGDENKLINFLNNLSSINDYQIYRKAYELFALVSPHSLHYSITVCKVCKEPHFWAGNTIIYPQNIDDFPPAEETMEEHMPDVYKIYNEAGSVLNASPRSSVFLLRMCLETICKNLGASGNTLKQKITSLEKKGFDIVEEGTLIRLVGNEGVHSIQGIDLQESKEDVLLLFQLINDIYILTILQPRKKEEARKKYTPQTPDNL